ncbi:hypothetical protein [Lichenibacterium dinghuense]|uniref:hypothetical protein n=1 Tax=Lichenibacterium dinghuense TaxID=2895977 RepID=UPI001F414E7B|nr:hypothetical protein [Lichenibacterium sp. 6Y81]
MNDAASEPEATRHGAAPRISLGKGRALVPVPSPAARTDFIGGLGRSHGVVAAGVAVVMGIGFVAGTAAFASKPQTAAVAQAAPPADTAMDVLNRVQGEVRALHASLDSLRASADDSRQADTIRGLKKSVDVLKQDLEGVKSASASAVGQLGAKIDKLDRDPGPKLNEIASRLDKLDRDPSPKLAEIAARLDKLDREPDAKAADAKIAQATSQLAARIDRVERQVASADATGSIPHEAAATAQAKPPLPPPRVAAQPAAPSPTGPVPAAVAAAVRPEPAKADPPKAQPPKPEPVARNEVAPPHPQDAPARPATVDGWLLRDVYGGVALVEGRAGGLREVAPGEYVPGVGEIRSIERRGRGWVVVTSRGLIQADNRW